MVADQSPRLLYSTLREIAVMILETPTELRRTALYEFGTCESQNRIVKKRSARCSPCDSSLVAHKRGTTIDPNSIRRVGAAHIRISVGQAQHE